MRKGNRATFAQRRYSCDGISCQGTIRNGVTELRHGLFTYVFIPGLMGGADGAPKDGKVTINELKSYIDDQVPEINTKTKGKPQYAYTFSRGHNFPVSIE